MDAPENKTYLTAEGAQKLRDELKFLHDVKQVELADRLRAAIQQGDLSENADYTAAKEEQSFLEGRILAVKRMLSEAEIIDETSKGSGDVRLGSRVVVQEEGFPEETFQIVGAAEANPAGGKISNVSPLGQSLMAKRAGAKVKVNTPDGSVTFKVIRVD